jgi:hypothetical protein
MCLGVMHQLCTSYVFSISLIPKPRPIEFYTFSLKWKENNNVFGKDRYLLLSRSRIPQLLIYYR